MDKTGDEAASKFISALIKSVQTLCHGYLDFQTGIEIIGHINLSVDKGSSLDYILKEKVCKNAENSTLFISNSFHAEPKSEQEVPGKQGQAGNQTVQNSEVADSGDSSKVSSAISSISSNLTGIRDRRQHSSGAKDSDSSYSHYRAGKRKASSDQMNDVCPAKVSSHHDSSRLSSDSPYRPNSSSPVDSKLGLQGLQTADGESSETMLPQTANVTDGSDIGVNLAGSVLEPVESQSNTDLPERDEDSDGDLEVTFIKEEYVEGDRSACEFDSSGQQYLGPHDRNSEGMPDPSVFPVALHSGSAPSTYVPSGHDPGAVGQQYPGGVPSQPQPGPSGSRGLPWSSVGRSECKATPPQSADLSTLQQSLDSSSRPPPSMQCSKPLVCEFCHAAFASNNGLRGHINKVHLHCTPFTCDICGKGFNFKRHFEGHMNTHNNVKAFKCSACSCQFTYRASLYRHVRDKHDASL
ncbi:uncharacterized protein LOC143293555 isoform X22 [Babylonia areolata]|uniref:uncharacterized protein LOC143293555 isoform X22 n=1 Tax=Babylonia areolata TaxID=304850 RepID=UPI003FD096A4